MNNLAGGVNPGIGSPGTMHSHRQCSDFAQGAFQRRLDGQKLRIWLYLPTAVASTIVLDTTGYAATRGERLS